MTSAREILRMEYGSARNFMTPDVLLRRLVSGNVAVELSSGDGMRKRGDYGPPPIVFGVSFVRLDPETGETRRAYGASGLFKSKADAHVRIRRVEGLLALLRRRALEA